MEACQKKRERKQFVVKCGFVQPILLSLYFVEERKNVWIVTLFAQFIHSYMRNVDRCMWYIHKCIALNAAYETFFSCVVLSALLHLPPSPLLGWAVFRMKFHFIPHSYERISSAAPSSDRWYAVLCMNMWLVKMPLKMVFMSVLLNSL